MSRFIQRREVTVTLPSVDQSGQHVTMTTDVMSKVYEVAITPTSRESLNATDEAIIHDLVKKLDPKYTGEVTEIPMGGYLELTEPEYVYFKKQVDAAPLWFGSFDYHPLIRAVYREWHEAPDKKPLAIGDVDPSAAERANHHADVDVQPEPLPSMVD